MDASGPANSTLVVILCVESDLQIENAQIIHLNLKEYETRACKNMEIVLAYRYLYITYRGEILYRIRC